MSFTNSTTYSRADLAPALEAAVALVAEESFFTMAEPAGDDFAAARDEHGEWLTASVSFQGSCQGTFDCTVPRTLARSLAAAFSGADDPDALSESDVDDLGGELANMICGRWLTTTHPNALFDLTAPAVTHTGPPDGSWRGMVLDFTPMAIRLVVVCD